MSAKANGTPAEREAAAAAMLQLDAVWNLDERVRSSVYATVQTVVQAWLDPAVDASATLDDPEEQSLRRPRLAHRPGAVQHPVPRGAAR